MKGLLGFLLVFACAAGLSSETVTMAAPRDDPELFALFVKTYKDAGIDLSIEVLPPLRCVANVKSGEMIGYLYSDISVAELFSGVKIVRIGFGSEPIYRFRGYAWVRAAEVTKWSVRAHWPTARVGVLLGIPVIRQLGELTGAKEFVEISSYAQIAKMLAADRFDMIVVPGGYLESLASGLQLVKLPDPVGEVSYWHILPGKYSGTPIETRIRKAFLANWPAFKRIADTSLKQ